MSASFFNIFKKDLFIEVKFSIKKHTTISNYFIFNFNEKDNANISKNDKKLCSRTSPRILSWPITFILKILVIYHYHMQVRINLLEFSE